MGVQLNHLSINNLIAGTVALKWDSRKVWNEQRSSQG